MEKFQLFTKLLRENKDGKILIQKRIYVYL